MTSVPEPIRIETGTRWDAVDLARRLAAHHTYLVQLGDRRWHVCVRDEDPAELLPTVRAAAQRWAEDRHLAATLRCAGETYELSG